MQNDLFSLIGKEGYVILNDVEYLGTIGKHKIPCKCIGLVSEDKIMTNLYNHGELWSGGIINIKDFIIEQ